MKGGGLLGMWVRSPPPLPTIFLIGRDLTKTRGGKRGQITSMIRFVREVLAARVTTGLQDSLYFERSRLPKRTRFHLS